MASGEGSRRSFITIAAFDPITGSLGASVQISFARMQTVGKRSLGHAKECGVLVPFALQQPHAVFEGLRRDEDEDPKGTGWRCYCARPPNSFGTDGSERPPYPNQVYLVFVNDEGVAYNWRWEPGAPEDRLLPEGHQQRFRKRLS